MMKRVALTAVLLGALVAGSIGQAQDLFNPGPSPFDLAPQVEQFDEAKLDQLLTELGIEHKAIELSGGYKAFTVVLDHKGGKRTHLMGIERDSGTVVIVGAAVELNVKAANVSQARLREMLQIVNRIAPTYLSINDKDIFVLNRNFGHGALTAKELGNQLAKFRTHFDDVYLPVMQQAADEASVGSPFGG